MHTPTPHLLTTPVSIKLDEHNFMVWQHQVMATIDGLRFLKYLEGKEAPPKYLNEESRASDIINPQYVHYHQQDRLIFTWLLMSAYFCPHSVFNSGYLIEFVCLKIDLIGISYNWVY